MSKIITDRIIVVDKHKLIFIPIAKSANSFMKYIVYNSYIRCENDMAIIRARFSKPFRSKNVKYIHLSKKEVNNYIKKSYEIIVFIRNPIDRAISQFNNKKERFSRQNNIKNIDFNIFLKRMNQIKPTIIFSRN